MRETRKTKWPLVGALERSEIKDRTVLLQARRYSEYSAGTRRPRAYGSNRQNTKQLTLNYMSLSILTVTNS